MENCILKTDNDPSKLKYIDGRNTYRSTNKNIDVKKSNRTKTKHFKICFGLVCFGLIGSTIFFIMNDYKIMNSSKSTSTGGDYFTSIVKMKELARLEQSVVAEINAVVNTFSTTKVESGSAKNIRLNGLSKIKSYLHDYHSSISPMVQEDTSSVEDVVASHPLISFRTLRRVAIDLPDILQYNEDGHLETLKNITALIQPAVTMDDVTGAIDGILRLQSTFLISSNDFAYGRLRNFETKSGLTERDCLLIGKRALKENQPFEAIEWILQSLRMLLERDVNDSIEVISMEMVRKALRNAIKLHNEEVVKLNPSTFGNAIETSLSEMTQDNQYDLMKTLPKRPLPTYRLFTERHSIQDNVNFKGACRGDKLRNETLTKTLKCYYNTNTPLLVIKPLKVEVHSHDPLIMQFYDLIPDFIINRYINTTIHRLRRALVVDKADGKVPSKNRIACSNFLDFEKNDTILRRVPEIIYEATGLNLIPSSSSEFSQVSTYGTIGGFYGTHWDSFETLDDDIISRGNRIATIMFYLTNVKLGGGTAFPKIGVLAEPIKGSAVFWYNLKKNGNRDDHTLHGGCPVLLGEKWVVNKWIRSGDQMFVRKCSLDSNV